MRKYPVFDIGYNSNYWDDNKNRSIIRKVADKCYTPMNNTVLDLIKKQAAASKPATA